MNHALTHFPITGCTLLLSRGSPTHLTGLIRLQLQPDFRNQTARLAQVWLASRCEKRRFLYNTWESTPSIASTQADPITQAP